MDWIIFLIGWAVIAALGTYGLIRYSDRERKKGQIQQVTQLTEEALCICQLLKALSDSVEDNTGLKRFIALLDSRAQTNLKRIDSVRVNLIYDDHDLVSTARQLQLIDREAYLLVGVNSVLASTVADMEKQEKENS